MAGLRPTQTGQINFNKMSAGLYIPCGRQTLDTIHECPRIRHGGLSSTPCSLLVGASMVCQDPQSATFVVGVVSENC
jgi:hypothetical protein